MTITDLGAGAYVTDPAERMSLGSIKVSKERLIQTLTTNRDAHKALYDEAVIEYHKAHLREAEAIVADARRGIIRRSITIPIPEEHTEDYQRAIDMLDWAMTDEVWLSQSEFAQYVRNEWGWLKTFTANTGSYTNR